MLTRDNYIAILEKRAADEAYNAAEWANKEVADNTKDNKTYLGGLFDQTSTVERHQTKDIGKLFPGKGEKEAGGQFLKVARVIFDDAMLSAHKEGLMKTASAAYREVAFHSFCQELEKIAAPSTAMHSAFQRVNGGRAANVVHVADPLDVARGTQNMPALAPSIAARRAKAAQPGVVGRVGGAIGRLFGR